MKFIAFRQALNAELRKERNEKKSTDRGRVLDDPSCNETPNERPLFRFLPAPPKITKVAGGSPRTPINATARKVISPAPWWAKLNIMNDAKTLAGKPHPAQYGQQIGTKTDSQMDSEVCDSVIKKTDSALVKSQELYARTCDARQALAVLADEWKVSWLDFIETCDKRLTDLRMKRMAIDSELSKLMHGFKDIRTFFLDKDYDTEIARLREFVSLCERLQKLKESGFLDTVADTMLKLSEHSIGS